MAIPCQFVNCGGTMFSHMYRVQSGLTPDFEWYKPTGKVPRVYRDHVSRGGLLIRKIEREGQA